MEIIDITDSAALTVRGTISFVGDEELVGAKQYPKRQVGVAAGTDLFVIEYFGRDIPADITEFERDDAVEAEFQISQRESKTQAGRFFTSLAGRALRRLDSPSGDGEDAPSDDGGMPF